MEEKPNNTIPQFQWYNPKKILIVRDFFWITLSEERLTYITPEWSPVGQVDPYNRDNTQEKALNFNHARNSEHQHKMEKANMVNFEHTVVRYLLRRLVRWRRG